MAPEKQQELVYLGNQVLLLKYLAFLRLKNFCVSHKLCLTKTVEWSKLLFCVRALGTAGSSYATPNTYVDQYSV